MVEFQYGVMGLANRVLIWMVIQTISLNLLV
jgi:hypothetical protein